MKRIIRVFPRRTEATPIDDLVRINCAPTLFDEADEVHVSVAFSYDLARAEKLAAAWAPVAPTMIGGPATGDIGGEFVPGMYLKHGYTITSRGCPNDCWFCCEAKKPIREIPIREGYNHVTGNLLACSEKHIRAVLASAKRAKKTFRKPLQFTGGLEAKRMIEKEWFVAALRELRPKQVFFAYDTPDDLEPLQRAGKMLRDAGWTTAAHGLRAYVLVGWPKDTFEAAERRIVETIHAGFLPQAMAYQGKEGRKGPGWGAWQRTRARAAIIATEYDAYWKPLAEGHSAMNL